MIENGSYAAKAIEWKLGLTSKGGEQIGVLFQLKESGQTITWYGYFTDLTTDRTLESLEYMGWDGLDITDPKGLDKNDVMLVIEQESNEKGTFAKVRWVNRLGGIAIKEELAGAPLANFKQRMAGTLIARRQAQGKPAPARPAARKSNPVDDFGPSNYDDEPPF